VTRRSRDNPGVSDDDAPGGRPRGFRTTRLEAFSDGVFAIAITLLVLEISVPAGSEDDLLEAVLDQWPSYLAYLVSFDTAASRSVRVGNGMNETTMRSSRLSRTTLLVSVLWRDVVREGLVRADAADEEVRTVTTRLTPSLAGYVAMIVLGRVAPVAAVLGYLVIALFLLVPFGAIRQHWSRH
jgi:hypothetical protein